MTSPSSGAEKGAASAAPAATESTLTGDRLNELLAEMMEEREAMGDVSGAPSWGMAMALMRTLQRSREDMARLDRWYADEKAKLDKSIERATEMLERFAIHTRHATGKSTVELEGLGTLRVTKARERQVKQDPAAFKRWVMENYPPQKRPEFYVPQLHEASVKDAMIWSALPDDDGNHALVDLDTGEPIPGIVKHVPKPGEFNVKITTKED